MRGYLRGMVVPFFAAFVPAVWYVDRNLTTDRLPPYVEPGPALIVGALGAAAVGSIAVAAVVALFRRRDTAERPLPYRQRTFRPDGRALGIFFGFLSLCLLLALVEMVGIGPPWLATALYPVLVPIALPFVVLAPLAIRYHWAVVLGLVASVLWMSFLATAVADALERRGAFG